jgi:hypothetical protein
VHNGNRLGLFVVFLIGAGFFFAGAIDQVSDSSDANPPRALVLAIAGLACAAIVAGALSGMRPPQPRWTPPSPMQPPVPPHGGFAQQQFPPPGQPGMGGPPQAYGAQPAPQPSYGQPQQPQQRPAESGG